MMLFAEPLALAPDPHGFLVFGGPGIAAAGPIGADADRSAATLLLLGVGEERLLQALFVAPDLVGHCNASQRSGCAMQQHQQSTKLDLIAGRAVRPSDMGSE